MSAATSKAAAGAAAGATAGGGVAQRQSARTSKRASNPPDYFNPPSSCSKGSRLTGKEADSEECLRKIKRMTRNKRSPSTSPRKSPRTKRMLPFSSPDSHASAEKKMTPRNQEAKKVKVATEKSNPSSSSEKKFKKRRRIRVIPTSLQPQKKKARAAVVSLSPSSNKPTETPTKTSTSSAQPSSPLVQCTFSEKSFSSPSPKGSSSQRKTTTKQKRSSSCSSRRKSILSATSVLELTYEEQTKLFKDDGGAKKTKNNKGTKRKTPSQQQTTATKTTTTKNKMTKSSNGEMKEVPKKKRKTRSDKGFPRKPRSSNKGVPGKPKEQVSQNESSTTGTTAPMKTKPERTQGRPQKAKTDIMGGETAAGGINKEIEAAVPEAPSEQQSRKPLGHKGRRRRGVIGTYAGTRCGNCVGCRAIQNCGKCIPCLDMPEFGGPGKMKKLCILRKCLNFSRAAGRSKRTSDTKGGASATNADIQKQQQPSENELDPHNNPYKLQTNECRTADELESLPDDDSHVEELSDMEWDSTSRPDPLPAMKRASKMAMGNVRMTRSSGHSAKAQASTDVASGIATNEPDTYLKQHTNVSAAELARQFQEKQRTKMASNNNDEEDSDDEESDDDFIPPPPPLALGLKN